VGVKIASDILKTMARAWLERRKTLLDPWWLWGGVLAFAIQSRVSIGFFLLVPAVTFLLFLAIVDWRGLWAGLTGFGTVACLTSLSLWLDPNAPDGSLGTVVLWASVAVVAYLCSRLGVFPTPRV
jgi:hypothetical protein